MTGEELVREVAATYGMSHLPPEAIDSVLWDHTAFPFGDEARWREQLHEFFSRCERVRALPHPIADMVLEADDRG